MAALVFLHPQASTAADDLPGAARELARKTSALSRGPVAVTYRNLSSLPDSEIGRVRREFEAALEAGNQAAPGVEARLTLSEDPSQFLLVEEARKGDESAVWIAAWKRAGHPESAAGGVVLEKRLVWEQEEPILDAAPEADGILVLSRSGLAWHGGPENAPPRQGVSVNALKSWPHDLRGRLRVNGDRAQVFLPGVQCEGLIRPEAALDCKASEETWVLESGRREILLANFAADRNYFDGRVVEQNGLRRPVAPFYSAAAFEDQGNTWWLLALVDGRTQVFDAALEAVATIPGWGSDLVGVSTRCAGGSQILATRPGDANEPDAVQAFNVVNRAAVAVGPPATFSGPVTALWPATPASALAVVRDLASGRYEAYTVTVACGP